MAANLVIPSSNGCHKDGCVVKSLKYGIPGGVIPTSCGVHKSKDMVKFELKCHIPECKIKTLNYNYPDKYYGISCGKHKVEGMLNIMKNDSPIPLRGSGSSPTHPHISPHIPIKSGVSFYPKDQPSDWLKARVFLSSLSDFGLTLEKI